MKKYSNPYPGGPDKLTKEPGRDKIMSRSVLVLLGIFAAVMVFVLYAQFALTMEVPESGSPACGIEEHTHGAECYEQVLICDISEFAQNASEYAETSEAGPNTSEEQTVESGTSESTTEAYGDIGGAEETTESENPGVTTTEEETTSETAAPGHVHTEDCYEYRLICGLDEHTHSDECYQDADDDDDTETTDETNETTELDETDEPQEITEPENDLPGGRDDTVAGIFGVGDENDADGDEYFYCLLCEAGILHGHAKASQITGKAAEPALFMGAMASPFMGIMAMAAPLDPKDTWDLRNFIARDEITDEPLIVIRDKDNNIMDINDIFYLGEKYTFSISFSERTGAYGQFGYNNAGDLEYDLPDALEIINEMTGKILVGTIEVGTYHIDMSGHVAVWFGNIDKAGNPIFWDDPDDPRFGQPKNFIDHYADVLFTINLEAEFSATQDELEILFGADASITIKINYPTPKIEVAKSVPAGGYDPEAETIKYQVTITAPASNAATFPTTVENIILTDTPRINSANLNAATQKIYSAISYRIGSGPETDITNSVEWRTTDGPPRLYYEFPSPVKLEPGQVMTVTYTLDLKTMIAANTATAPTVRNLDEYEFDVNNAVTVKTDHLTKDDSTTQHVKKKNAIRMTKATVPANYTYDPVRETVDYIVTITADSDNISSVKITELTDIPRIGSSSGNGSGSLLSLETPNIYSSVKYTYRNNTEDITDKVTWVNISGSGNPKLNYVFPEGTEPSLAPGETMTVTYTIDVRKLVGGNTTSTRDLLEYDFYINNTVTAKTDILPDVTTYKSQRVRKTFNISKTAGSRNGDDNFISWTATVGDHLTVLNGGTITDTLSVRSGGSAANISFPPPEEITVELYRRNSSGNGVTLIGTYKASDFGDALKITGNTYTFKVPDGFGGYDIAQVVFKYKTPVTLPPSGSSSYTYRNRIEYDRFYINRDVDVGPGPEFGANIAKSAQSRSRTTTTETVRWTATIGSGAYTLNWSVITDILDSRLSFPAAGSINITLYGKPNGSGTNLFLTGDRVGNRVFTASELAAYINITGNTLTFTVPAEGTAFTRNANGWSGTVPKIYRVVIEYDTPIAIPGVGESKATYVNDIYWNDLDAHAEIDIEPKSPDAPTIKKESSGIRYDETTKEYFIEYTIKMTVPEGNMGSNIYLRDRTYAGTETIYPGSVRLAIDNVNEGEPPFTSESYYGPVTAVSGSWDIYFGGQTAGNSRWQYDTAKTVTVTYTMPLHETVVAYLKGSRSRIVNNSVDIGGDFKGHDEVTDSWPIFKSGTASAVDESVFDYTVTVYGPMFNITGEALFIDTFDPAVFEYVPKSLYGREYRWSSSYFGPYANDQVGKTVANATESPVTIEDGTIKVDLSTFNRLTWNGNMASSVVAEFNHDVMYGAGSNVTWYSDSGSAEQKFTIHYQLRLKDPNQPDGLQIRNEATIISTVRNADFSNETTVTYEKRPPVTKEMMTDGTDVAEVEIIINPTGRMLRTEEFPDPWFIADDVMSSELSFYLNSMEIYTKDSTDGSWSDWRPVAEGDKEPVTGIGNLYDVKIESAQELKILIPDEKPIKIVYKVRIMVEVGQTVTFENEINVWGTAYTAMKENYKVMESSANGNADRGALGIIKQDKETSAPLAGAEFELYMALPNGGFYGPEPDENKWPKKITVGGYDFYYVQTAKYADGSYTFESEWLTPTYSNGTANAAIYLINESKIPVGYKTPDSPYTFVTTKASRADKTAIETKLGATLVEVDNVLRYTFIYNEPVLAEVNLKAEKIISGGIPTEPRKFEFELAETVWDEARGWEKKESGYTDSVEITGEGTEEFKTISGLKPGDYYYMITEKDPGDNDPAWKYDASVYIVHVNVTVNAAGTGAVVTIKYMANTGEGWPQGWTAYPDSGTPLKVKFTNEYGAGPKLPETGGVGTLLLTVMGTSILLSAAGVMVYRKNLRKINRKRRAS